MQQEDGSIRMNTSAVVISLVGFASSIFTCFMNIFLLKTYVKKKNDMALFYCRFTLDVILGALVAAFLLFVVFYSFFSDQLSQYQNLVFYLSFPASNVGAMRSIITLSVAVERIATIFALTFIFSLLLCIKLFIINKIGKTGTLELSRVNRLALIDAATVCIFDFLPSFIANQFSNTQFFSFQNIGPYGAVAKLFGCAIEAFLVYRTLTRNKEAATNTVENSKSIGMVMTRRMTEVRVD